MLQQLLEMIKNLFNVQENIETLQSIEDSKTWGRLLPKAISNIQTISLIGILFIVLYFITYDKIWVPGQKTLTTLDGQIDSQKSLLSQKQQENQQFQLLIKQTKDIPISILDLKSGQSPKVLAVGESGAVVALAKGGGQTPSKLPPPHNSTKVISLKPLTDGMVNILSSEALTDQNAAINMLQFTYELNVQGTYASISDFINRLVVHPNLVTIDKLVLSLKSSSGAYMEPDHLNMTLTFSIYFYDPTKN